MTDSFDHVKEFEAYLDAYNATDVAKCKSFPITLEKNAENWFKSLTAGFITSFKDVRMAFITKFLPSKK